MLFPSVMGFSAGIASNGGFKQAEGYGDTAVAALHDLTRKILGREFSHEIKTQVIPKLAAN
ncbi:MAG TPA: hypothetical protein VHP58_05800 [Alphaproteobacteria bacterium]|nr:hypothetical protein [Alphaproteobacteria bacterium]